MNLNPEALRPAPDRVARDPAVDALRGYAALIVVIAHTTVAGIYQVEPLWSTLKWLPVRLFWSGHQAVILFFVLSGFSLALMLRGNGQATRTRYWLARVARLYPPYVASLLVAMLGYGLLRAAGFDWKPGWMNVVAPEVSPEYLAAHAAMVGKFATWTINPPIWSIVHEMRLSLVFPVLLWLTLRFDWGALLIGAAGSVAYACLFTFARDMLPP